jgi:hypothetical protein
MIFYDSFDFYDLPQERNFAQMVADCFADFRRKEIGGINSIAEKIREKLRAFHQRKAARKNT